MLGIVSYVFGHQESVTAISLTIRSMLDLKSIERFKTKERYILSDFNL